MAKKILYKIKAYHCPKCGGITDPKKKYCEYCGRELIVRTDIWHSPLRLLVDSGNYIYWDEIMDFNMDIEPQIIDCTCLEDTTRRYLKPRNTERKFQVVLPMTWRTAEILQADYKGIHNIRFEYLGKREAAMECESYISEGKFDIGAGEIGKLTLNFVSVGGVNYFSSAIPEEIMRQIRCPNCGAPIDNRLGTCRFCSGWSEVMWQ